MVSFEKFYKIEEAISLKNVRKTNLRRSSGGAYHIDIINQIFGNKDRLVYDIDLNTDELINPNNPIIKKILEFLEKHYPDYELKNKKDYIDGICFKKRDTERKQPTKIGRMLQKHINEKGVSDLLNSFKKDPIRSTKLKTSKVVISRHPYDIAGMSTDRSWRSCMTYAFKGINYPDQEVIAGINVRYVQNDIEKGSIVAYLVSPEDVLPNGKIALKRPLSRILMKPHKNIDNSNDYAYSLGIIYGASNRKFGEFVKKWLIENINKNTEGKIYLKNTALYEDGDYTPNFTAVKTDSKMITDIFFEDLSYNTDPQYFDNFTINNGEGDYGGVFLEFGIRFTIPDNIELSKFRYERNDATPKYIKEILNKINIQEKNNYIGRNVDFSLIESFEDTNTLLIEYRYNDPYYEPPVDEEGNPIDDREFQYDYWSDVIRSCKIQNINYIKILNDVVDILSKADPEKERNEELESIKNDFRIFIQNSIQGEIKGQRLKNNFDKFRNDKIKFENAIKYINSLGTLSVKEFVNIYKSDVFSESMKIINDYYKVYNDIKTAFMLYVPQNYSLIYAREEWSKMTTEYLDFKNSRPNTKALSITEFINQLQDIKNTVSAEEYNDIRDKYDDYRSLSKN